MDEQRRKIIAWVAHEVMPHEAAVRGWLRRFVVNRDEADDLIQEAYARLSALEAVEHIDRPDGYFFQTVRNLLLEQVRRSHIVSIESVTEIDALPIYSDEPSPEQAVAARRELEKVFSLIEGLPERCRRIFELRKIHGLSQREIAKKMGVSESIVENDGARGLRLIMAALREEAASFEQKSKGKDGKSRNAR